MLICVDGTDGWSPAKTPSREATYAQDMAGSFVGMIHSLSHEANRKYYQGPGDLGAGPNMILPNEVYGKISEFWCLGDQRIFMTGYSRGAAIVISTAALMTDLPMPGGQYAQVEAMFLFDAVDKSFTLPRTQLIPSNVNFCYHAMRDDAAGSRASFGHCGTAKTGANTVFVQKSFYTTHGGMGGTPWGEKGLLNVAKSDRAYAAMGFKPPTREKYLANNPIFESLPDGITNVTPQREQEGSDAVQHWMWPFLHLRMLDRPRR